jgi:tetratricopeptide (TPR) repeat protein
MIADVFVSWLIGLVLDEGRKRLTIWILGTEQERALRQAAHAAIRRTARDLSSDDEQAARIEMVIGQVFAQPVPRGALAENATILEAILTGIGGQLAVLADPAVTGAGQSSAEPHGLSVQLLSEKLALYVLQEILDRGARGGPLQPLASQLNHDVTHLQGMRMIGMIGRLNALVERSLAQLDVRVAGSIQIPAAAIDALPSDIASFMGRQAELDQLMGGLPTGEYTGGVVRILAIDGMPGIGKTAFAVHAAHQLASGFPDGQLFLRMHGHTPGQLPVEPADALAALLLADGVAPQAIPAGTEARAVLWRQRMAGRKKLLVLDDAISSDQVRPLLPDTAGILVMITSRRRLAALPEALPVTLDTLTAANAAQLLVRLTGRSGMRPGDESVTDVVALCGYLPLAIRLMAGHLKHHPAWTAADLASELTSLTDRLELMVAENVSVAAAFDLSYRNLGAAQQQLFRRLGLHPGADLDVYACAALSGTDLASARRLVDDLYGYHLIEEPVRGRYRFHDLIRQRARVLAATDPVAETDAALSRLLDYYLFNARAANRHLARRTPTWEPDVIGSWSAAAPDLLSWEQAIAWMDLERLNLHAAADYAALHRLPYHAIAIPAATRSYLGLQGHWEQALILDQIALDSARNIDDRHAEASALTDLGTAQSDAGDYPAATTSLARALELYRGLGELLGVANSRTELNYVQSRTGDYSAATDSLIEALNLYRHLGDRLGEARVLTALGGVQVETDDYPAASVSLSRALQLYRDLQDRLGEAHVLNDLGIVRRETGDYPAAVAGLTQALKLYRDLHHRRGEANALQNLGAAQQEAEDYPAATASQTRALKLFRDLHSRLGEAFALDRLGTLQRIAGDYSAASSNLTRALELRRELGNPIGQAETLNNLGELSLAIGEPSNARTWHEQALTIATAIVSPLEKARALEGIGKCHLHEGTDGEAAAMLRQAFAIYQRIGSPNSRRVETVLHDRGL